MTEPVDRDIEARLRRALHARADAVEPGTTDVGALASRAQAARRDLARRRTLLSLAAAVVVVAGVVGALALADRPESVDVVTPPEETTTTPTTGRPGVLDPARFESPAIWPFADAGEVYDTPERAASAFWTGYLGHGIDDCLEPATVDGRFAVAPICGIRTLEEVLVRDDGDRGWVVVGSESAEFDLTAPAPNSAHTVEVPVEVAGDADVEVELRALGSLSPERRGPVGPLAVGDLAPGPYVLIARTELTATVRVVDVVGGAAPTSAPTTTSTPTTTAPPADDGVVGYEGGFADPVDAAVAFADDVLGFADTTVQDTTEDGPADATVTVTARPNSAPTELLVHDTGARGWVVTGARSTQGRIDEPAAGVEADLPVVVSGEATAFEATLVVRLVSLGGTTVVETFTQAGSNGEVAPFRAELDPGPGADLAPGPYLVLIGEGDASGEGDLNWAAVVLVTL